MVYNYKTHEEIPSYMRDYILGIVDCIAIEQLDINDINNFLNGYEEWEDYIHTTLRTIH
jgi:hypothetical protein